MKKTLAAILAAAMALSMSAVAFAKNFEATPDVDVDGDVVTGSTTKTLNQVLGKSRTYLIEPGTVVGRLTAPANVNLTKGVLNTLIANGDVKVDVSILSNKKALDGTPTVTTGKVSGSNPVEAAAVMKVSFKDTWGTGSETVEMRIRITAKKDLTVAEMDPSGVGTDVVLQKGDTVTLDSFKVEAKYGDIQEYGENITMTKNEMDTRDIVADGESLYNAADDNDKVIIYFKDKRDRDIAAFDAKISPNQKSVNLGYDTDAISEVVDAYPDIDFEFINFKAQASGANRFQNSGTLYFNAIGNGDTCVYEVVDGVIDPSQPLDAKYDADDKTVSVSGIRYLTQYVVASEALPYDDEPAEDSSSEAPAEVPETPANPSTGAL